MTSLCSVATSCSSSFSPNSHWYFTASYFLSIKSINFYQVLYWELANTYGSVFSFVVGLILRLLCGDKTMGIPAAIEFGKVYADCPTEEDPNKICEGAMPFRLFVTLIGAAVHVIIR